MIREPEDPSTGGCANPRALLSLGRASFAVESSMKTTTIHARLLATGILVASLACSPTPAAPSSCSGSFDALVAMSDYVSSEVGRVSLSGASDAVGGADLGMDPSLASSAGRYFWVARDLEQIIELNPTCLSAMKTFEASDPGEGPPTNPYDVAVAPDESLWVARFGVPTLLVLNPDGSRKQTIDLSSLDPVDGNPNMNSVRILDPVTGGAGTMATAKAFVSLEILDSGLQSNRPSKLARIDLQSGRVEDVLTLAGRNPLSLMVQLGNRLYLADAGNWCVMGECPAAQKDAGIEVVDTASFTSRLLVDGVNLGGHATELAVTADCGAVIVAGAYPTTPTSLVRFDPETGALGTASERTVIPTTTSFTLAGLAWVDGETLLVGDRGSAGGASTVRVFDADVGSGCTLKERPHPLSVPLPPVGFASLR
jgi:hypothetical protein